MAGLWGRLVSMCGAAVCLLSHVSTGNVYGRFIIILIFAKGRVVPACGRDNQVNPGTIPVHRTPLISSLRGIEFLIKA